MTKQIIQSLTRASQNYADNVWIRAAMQAVPHVGGSLDTLFAARGVFIQQKRIESLIKELHAKFQSLESVPPYNEEEFLDLTIRAIEASVKTRADDKRSLYANILAKHIANSANIEESEAALRITAELSLVHLRILRFSLVVGISKKPLEDLRAFSVICRGRREESDFEIPSLEKAFPEYSIGLLQSACSELLAKGLIYDEGIGRMDIKSMEIFIATETAAWLDTWLRDNS
jgi:hypothetical protein